MTMTEPVVLGALDSVQLCGRDFIIVAPGTEIGVVVNPGIGREDGVTIIENQRGAPDSFKSQHPSLLCSSWPAKSALRVRRCG